MMDIERELKSALRRKSPSPGFSDRVIAQLEVEEIRPRRSGGWRAIAAAGLFTVILGGWTAHEIAERRQGERARDEVLLALRITSEKLQEAHRHVVK